MSRSVELVGRAAEMAALTARASAAARGTPQLVVVTGEAGIGKTRLVGALVATLDAAWSVVHLGAGDGTPTSPVADATAATLRPILAGSPGLGAGEAATAPPVLAVLEDAHWADPAALRVLPAALDRLAGRAALLVVTYRLGAHPPGSPHPAALAQALRHPAAGELRLHGLDPEAAATLARSLGAPPAAPEHLHERTGGNPLFIEHLATADPALGATTLTQLMRRQVDTLPPPAVELAEILAVAGGALEWPVLRTVVADADTAFAALRDAGLARWSEPDSVALHHAAIGEALVTTLPSARSVRGHATLVRALPAAGRADPLRVATHLWGAGEDTEAVRLAEQAAEEATRERRHHQATRLYEIALRLHPTPELLTNAARVASRSGDLARAARWAADAATAHQSSGDAQAAAAVWLLPELRYIPKPPVGTDHLEPGSVVRLLEETKAQVAAGRADVALATSHLAARAAADRPLDLFEACRALYYAGDLPAALAIAEQAAVGLKRAGNPLGESDAHSMAAQISFAAGDVAGATEAMRRAVAAAEADPSAPYWGLAVATYAMVLAARGEISAAEDELARLATNPMAELFSALPRAAIAVERDDLALAARLAEPLPALYGAMGSDFGVAQALVTLAGVAVVAGDHERARRLVSDARAAEPALHSYLAPDLALFDALASHALGQPEGIDDALRRVSDHARVATGPTVTAAAAAVAGLRSSASGDHRAAASSLLIAARTFSAAPRHSLAGHAWCLAATELAAAGDDPGPALDEAVGLARRHGIVRVERLARRLQVAADGAGHKGASTGLESLTRREREIARLAARGLSNREIGTTLGLAETTVRNYLATAFAKLQVTRRTQIAARLRDAGEMI